MDFLPFWAFLRVGVIFGSDIVLQVQNLGHFYNIAPPCAYSNHLFLRGLLGLRVQLCSTINQPPRGVGVVWSAVATRGWDGGWLRLIPKPNIDNGVPRK